LTTFSDITTFAVGGEIQNFIDCATTKKFIKEIKSADGKKEPLFIIGYGSNTLASDKQFKGTVLRPVTSKVKFKRHKDCKKDNCILATAEAGANFTEFVSHCIESSFAGLESLIGIPGTIGASPVQNIGAYGSQLSDAFYSAEVYNRKSDKIETLFKNDMQFGYRTSILKQKKDKFSVSEKIVLSVSFCLQNSNVSTIKNSQLAKALDLKIGKAAHIYDIARALIAIRENKGTLIDPNQRKNGFNIQNSIKSKTLNGKNFAFDYNRWSAGSFFTNPIIEKAQLKYLPKDAPFFEIESDEIPYELQSKTKGKKLYKLSGSYLIENAGFKKGFSIGKNAALSDLNPLVLTNRGNAKANEIINLAKTIENGVKNKFKISLSPEVNILNY
jgi:UDP-N-acetylmuramate dehydrogenase